MQARTGGKPKWCQKALALEHTYPPQFLIHKVSFLSLIKEELTRYISVWNTTYQQSEELSAFVAFEFSGKNKGM